MNSSKILSLVASVLFITTACTKQKKAESETTEVETTETEAVIEETKESTESLGTITWTGTKITGDSHTGTIDIKENNLTFEEGQLTGGSIIVDMTTITDTDLEGEWKQKLEGHLNSDDFFGTATFPTSTLAIKSIEAGEGDVIKVTADLTIKETTLEEAFEVTKTEQDGKVSYTAVVEIDRTKYNVKYGSSNFFEDLGDKAINDIFKLEVTL
ncbi:YceI family protein [Reichenbachiella versicolor]|uniref:YceI family protein n=1 Tax=Reichenbachiella versicolor TaxID=1821036 RepID=UPI000D6EA8DB|nr:YceI family protein [Reichenbachiella versicolor]